MTTVKQLREYLATLPDDAEVRVLKTVTRNYETFTKFVPLQLPDRPEHPFTDNVGFWGRMTNGDVGYLDLGEE